MTDQRITLQEQIEWAKRQRYLYTETLDDMSLKGDEYQWYWHQLNIARAVVRTLESLVAEQERKP